MILGLYKTFYNLQFTLRFSNIFLPTPRGVCPDHDYGTNLGDNPYLINQKVSILIATTSPNLGDITSCIHSKGKPR